MTHYNNHSHSRHTILKALCAIAVCATIITSATSCGKDSGSGTASPSGTSAVGTSSVTASVETDTVTESTHIHTPSDTPEVVKEATCTEDGEENILCTECGEIIDTQVIPATGHTTDGVEWVVTTEATCEHNAVSSLICSTCGETVETREDEGTQLEHTYGQWKQTKKSTCSEAGEKERTCSVCGYVDVKTLSLASHTYGDWVETTAPTCTTAGVETRTCTVCGNKETQNISATGHTWKDYGNGVYWTVTKEPTCIADGEKMCECTVCGHTSTKAIAHDGTEHNVTNWTTSKASTCTTAGTKSGKCSVCGETITASLPLADHSYSAWTVTKSPTTTSEGTETRTCSVCGKTESRTTAKLTASTAKTGDILTIGTYMYMDGTRGRHDLQYEVVSVDKYGVMTLEMLPINEDPDEYYIWSSSYGIDENDLGLGPVADNLYYYYDGTLLKKSETVNHLCEHNPVFLTFDTVYRFTDASWDGMTEETTVTCSICGKQYTTNFDEDSNCTYSDNFKGLSTSKDVARQVDGTLSSPTLSYYVFALNMAYSDNDTYYLIDDEENSRIEVSYNSSTDCIVAFGTNKYENNVTMYDYDGSKIDFD